MAYNSFQQLRNENPERFDNEIRNAIKEACEIAGKETVIHALFGSKKFLSGEENGISE